MEKSESLTATCPRCHYKITTAYDLKISKDRCPSCGVSYSKSYNPYLENIDIEKIYSGYKPKNNKQKEKTKEEIQFIAESKKKAVDLLQLMTTSFFIAFVLIKCDGDYSTSPEKTKSDKSLDALFICQQSLKSLSFNRDKADFPYVKNFGSKGEYYFAWGASTKFGLIQNKFNQDIFVSAYCIVDGDGKTIKSLVVEGHEII